MMFVKLLVALINPPNTNTLGLHLIMRAPFCLLLLFLSMLSGCYSKKPKLACDSTAFKPGNYTLLKNAKVFDGISDEVLNNYSVLVKDDVIFDVAPDAVICVPKDVKVLALDGRLLSPGLIESHGHQTFNEPWEVIKGKLEKLIYSGITGIRNMAGRVPSYKQWSDKIDAGEIVGPNIYSSAFFAGQAFFNVDGRLKKYRDFGDNPGDEDWMKIVDAELDIPDAVRKAKESGATGIKLYASLSPAWVQRITTEAKKNDLRVWSHAHLQLTETEVIIDAKVDSVSHAEMFGHTISHENEVVKNHTEVDTDRVKIIFSKMVESGIYFDVTLQLYYKYYGGDSGKAKLATQIVKMANEMGVLIVSGSDSEGFWDEGNIALYDEMITLVEVAGMSPESVLKSATYNPARLLGVEADYGSVSKGKKADLVVFNANPLKNIQHVREIYLTMKNGVVYQNL